MIKQPRNSYATNRGWVSKETGELLVAINGLKDKLILNGSIPRKDKLNLTTGLNEPDTGIKAASDITPEIEQTREGRIIEAISLLDPEDKTLWTKTGMPNKSAIEDILGFNISASERTQAWNEIKGE